MKSKRRLLVPVLLCLLLMGSLAYGGLTWFQENVDRSGWHSENGLLYYQDFHGESLSGWQALEGQRYFFREDGSALTGWQELEGNRHHFGPNGVLSLGWQDIEGSRYYFGNDGVMRQDWLELEDAVYYLPEGAMVSSWQVIEGKPYYFAEDGRMLRGFASIEGDLYYFHDDGVMVTGETELSGQQYYFKENGIMHTGWWETEEGKKYYLPEGPMALGWQVIGDGLYLFQESGHPTVGWYQEGEYSYYFLETGAAAVGPTEIDGNVHYFTPKGKEVVLVNGNNKVPSWYTPDLVTIEEEFQVDARCYDALTAMLEGCINAGIEYEFNSGYRTIKLQEEILDYRIRSFMTTYELNYQDAKERALRIVAVPGTSEHHLGLAVDLLGDEAKAWFQENCWDYGFIVRYAEGKERWTGIADEDWHFRYVGKEIALDLKDSGLCLEEYLGAEAVKPWME